MACIITGCSAFNSTLHAVQRLRYGKRLREVQVDRPPVFIIGHWRSGTTLLHELLVRDPQFAYPNTYECFAPSHFLVSEWIIPRLVGFLLPKRRPMDNMGAGFGYPQEDEFAICIMGAPSPYSRLAFPNHKPEYLEFLDMVEIPDSSDVMSTVETLKEMNPELIVSVRVPALAAKLEHVMELAAQGLDAIHCVADERGYEPGEAEGLHVKDIIRTVHGELLKASLRDEITFIASGGIAMAEHVIKAMLCGANLVAVDIPLLIALECRVCRNCLNEVACPVEISTVDSEWGARRIVNLMGAWHNQMLEMMGAMGIREARRLRGEQGRVMFFEDLESETFAKLFGGSNQ
ncbi:MAG: glutamate synthase-related protein [Planctomycetes bacterium]|nr:glutamate synthase-related protein [Planctomycetota bacterium]